jgi:hypothetical protein
VIHRSYQSIHQIAASPRHKNRSTRARVGVLDGFRKRIKSSTRGAAGCLRLDLKKKSSKTGSNRKHFLSPDRSPFQAKGAASRVPKKQGVDSFNFQNQSA